MKKEKNEQHFINRPSYEGGNKAMGDFIRKHLKYPADALKAKIEGVVQVRIAINHNGQVEDGKVLSSLGYGCNEEAIRVVKLLKFNVPKNRKLKVKFHKKLNVQFKLPKQKPQPVSPKISQVSYTVKKEASVVKKTPVENKKDYSYTIKW